MDKYEDIYKAIVRDAVKQAKAEIARGNAIRQVQNGAPMQPQRGGNGWRFGMKMGSANLG